MPRCPDAMTRRAGFTLVEVLMALVIFALAASVLGASYVGVLAAYHQANRGMEANHDFAFARRQVLTEPDRKKLEKGGDFDTADGRKATWSVDIASTTLPDVFAVTFNCELAGAAATQPERYTETFTVLRPTWVIDAGEQAKLRAEVRRRIEELQGKLKPQR
jgi:general secretion pathway protein I